MPNVTHDSRYRDAVEFIKSRAGYEPISRSGFAYEGFLLEAKEKFDLSMSVATMAAMAADYEIQLMDKQIEIELVKAKLSRLMEAGR